MNIRSLLSLILLFATTFDTTLFAAKRSFDEVDDSELYSDDDFCDDDKQEDDKNPKSKPSSSKSIKPYPCRAKTCGKSFTQSGSRNRHEESHPKIKPYSCQHCGESFLKASDRNHHKRSHPEEISYPCQYCGLLFTRLYSCARHQKNSTKNSALNHESDDLSDTQSDTASPLPPDQQAKLDPGTLHFITTAIILMQAHEAQSLPQINQGGQPFSLPNLNADDVEHYLRDTI